MKLLKIILYSGILIILLFIGLFIAWKEKGTLSKFVKPRDIPTTFVEKPIYKTYKVPILTYHYIEYPTNPDDTIRKGLTVLPSNFEAQIINLREKIMSKERLFCSSAVLILQKALTNWLKPLKKF